MITGQENGEKRHILGVGFDLLDYTRAFEAVVEWRGRGERRHITLTNPHSVMMCRRDEEMKEATVRAGLTLPDGVGVIVAARLLGYEHAGRVTGPTLLLRLCDWGRSEGFRHYFYGGKDGVAKQLAAGLSERYPGLQIAGTCAPPFRTLSPDEDEAVIEQINAARPDIVWVGLGAPKQEKWMLEHAGRVAATAMIGVGAAFDFHSDNVPWAPGWVRRLGIEWAYRLIQNPRRLWRRNIDSPLFMLAVLRQRFGRSAS